MKQVFYEKLIVTAKRKDINPDLNIFRERDGKTLKFISPTFYRIKRDLSVTPTD